MNTEEIDRKIRNCKIALNEKMDALLSYSNGLLANRYGFDQDELSNYVESLKSALHDYERAVDEYIQRQN
jgi:uncharacterized protein YukE